MFETLSALPADPILGLSVACRLDNNPNKIDLGIGVYKDSDGNTPVLKSVQQAQQEYLGRETSKAYMPMPGSEGANEAVQALIFGADRDRSRIRTSQTTGGTGALRIAAELIKRAKPDATVWISDPSWGNHRPLLEDAGLNIEVYPYYDETTRSVRFDAMSEALKQAGKDDVVLLHGCCHNPCGADLNKEQWQAVADLALDKGFTPFIDLAYQGFGDGLEEDAFGARLMASLVPELIVASSCSKNFGLYRERTGSLSILCENSERADIGFSQVLNIVRAIYSMPPSNGSLIVETILNDSALTSQWHSDLDEMRTRIKSLRSLLSTRLNACPGIEQDFSFIEQQHGMFSYLGISPAQVKTLKEEYSIYMLGSSRINVAGINANNIDYFTSSIESVL